MSYDGFERAYAKPIPNLLTQFDSVTDTYSYDSHDHLTSTSSKRYSYDANGNRKTVISGTSTMTLTYEDENRVTGIAYPNSSTNSFAYNGPGLRVSKNDSAGAFRPKSFG